MTIRGILGVLILFAALGVAVTVLWIFYDATVQR